jgi:hypothetical protein
MNGLPRVCLLLLYTFKKVGPLPVPGTAEPERLFYRRVADPVRVLRRSIHTNQKGAGKA